MQKRISTSCMKTHELPHGGTDPDVLLLMRGLFLLAPHPHTPRSLHLRGLGARWVVSVSTSRPSGCGVIIVRVTSCQRDAGEELLVSTTQRDAARAVSVSITPDTQLVSRRCSGESRSLDSVVHNTVSASWQPPLALGLLMKHWKYIFFIHLSESETLYCHVYLHIQGMCHGGTIDNDINNDKHSAIIKTINTSMR